MILRTQNHHTGIDPLVHSPGSDDRSSRLSASSPLQSILDVVAELSSRYEISALSGLLATARDALGHNEITLAVLGRFKAGKSSFLNHFVGREVLPVGVVPVTATVTEMRFGPHERATVHCLNGPDHDVRLEEVKGYISEKENPENSKGVRAITIEVPELRKFRGLKFVDTPGLESALAHNTQTSLDWLPNVGLALVAVSVDPPLSQRDIDLLKSLYQYTPKVAVLLTKADLVTQTELNEVVEYVRGQLAKNLAGTPAVFPYSTKPGLERFRDALEGALLTDTLGNFSEEREAILSRKVETLVRECGDFLCLSLRSAERIQAERQQLKDEVIGERDARDEIKSQVRLVVQSAAASTRRVVSGPLEAHQHELERLLLRQFDAEFPKWTKSLGLMLSSFENWLATSLREHLTEVSIRERGSFVGPLHRVQKQTHRMLQQFRDRLSERTMHAFGVPLRTTEPEIRIAEPKTPDIRIGRVFDRSWELLSPILPVWMIKSTVRRHFEARISYLIYQNLSRLTTQWEESVHGALWAVEKEAQRRLDELINTVERLLDTRDERAPEIRAEIERLQRVSAFLSQEQQ